MRRVLLWCAQNTWLATHVPRWRFARRAVRRFLPGEGFDSALKAAVGFRSKNIGALFTLLGENITDLAAANKVVEHYEEVLAASMDVQAEISVKPTQLGLDIDEHATYANLQRLARAAEKANSFLWIDMEGSAYTDRTIALYRRLRAEAPRVGLALQAYLYRTVSDIATLMPLTPAIRLVKGAYSEAQDIAFVRKRDVDANYLAGVILGLPRRAFSCLVGRVFVGHELARGSARRRAWRRRRGGRGDHRGSIDDRAGDTSYQHRAHDCRRGD